MNGAALVSGLATGGPAGARQALDKLWRETNQSGGKNVFGDTSIWSNAMHAGVAEGHRRCGARQRPWPCR